MGGTPLPGLILDQARNLYGTTKYGGNASGNGTVFKLTPHRDGSWTEQMLHTFCSLNNCDDGGFPVGGVIFDQRGNLYGTTSQWPNGGLVFKLTPHRDGSWTDQVLYKFGSLKNNADGEWPTSGLVYDQAGNLYGTTVGGGDSGNCISGCGVVFKLTLNVKGKWRERVLHRFGDHPGARPLAGVILDAAGNLYGTTYGDTNNTHKTLGSVFEIAP